ncbi:MAG: 3-phosphoglycerate dehydrogenase [Chloroflexi bacterium]|nr:MAG: 3-phosphoglycerate dehydrogenase [Chloroflexota bacterium]
MKILILAPFDAGELDQLRRVAEVVHESWIEHRQMLAPVDLAARLVDGGFDVVAVEAEFVTREVMETVPGLRVVASARGKPVNIDIEAATELSRVVLQTPGRNAESVADLCLGMILDRVRHICAASELVRQGGWVYSLDDQTLMPYLRFRGRELGSLTLGLLGLGAVGRAVARRARAFGMRVIATDPYQRDDVFHAEGVSRVDLDGLLGESDIVSIHVELTPETTGLLDADRLRSMRRGAILVNTARAKVVDQAAMVELLRSGHLGAVALDVFHPEPIPADHPLLNEPRALLLPHIGGATDDVVRHHSRMIREDLERLMRGERPVHCANPQVLDAVGPMG